ncbi:hypothetical protein EDD22DRAFT_966509 [Suillus occidentalis]|nr:hypothetical protein EDD22DRAFT_966509 [Suillus occidentalis]
MLTCPAICQTLASAELILSSSLLDSFEPWLKCPTNKKHASQLAGASQLVLSFCFKPTTRPLSSVSLTLTRVLPKLYRALLNGSQQTKLEEDGWQISIFGPELDMTNIAKSEELVFEAIKSLIPTEIMFDKVAWMIPVRDGHGPRRDVGLAHGSASGFLNARTSTTKISRANAIAFRITLVTALVISVKKPLNGFPIGTLEDGVDLCLQVYEIVLEKNAVIWEIFNKRIVRRSSEWEP